MKSELVDCAAKIEQIIKCFTFFPLFFYFLLLHFYFNHYLCTARHDKNLLKP